MAFKGFDTYFSEQSLESFYFIFSSVKFAAWQFEESCAELEQQDVRQSVLMNQQNALNWSPHSNLLKFIAHSLKSSRNRRIFLKQWLLGSKCVICQRISESRWIKLQQRVHWTVFQIKCQITYKLMVLFSVSDWLTGTFIKLACGSNLLFFGQPWPAIVFCCWVCAIFYISSLSV